MPNYTFTCTQNNEVLELDVIIQADNAEQALAKMLDQAQIVAGKKYYRNVNWTVTEAKTA